MKNIKKILKCIGNIILIFFLVCGLLSVYSKIQMSKNPGEIPSILGMRNFTVLSGSMKPYIQPGDIIISKEVNANLINEKDIITYKLDEDTIVTHRVVQKKEINGKYQFKTKGDANNIEDESYIEENQIIGKFLFKVPYLGYVLFFMRSKEGFVLIFGLIFIFTLGSLIKYISNKDKDKPVNDNTEVKN